jgi:CBS domain-containing protein
MRIDTLIAKTLARLMVIDITASVRAAALSLSRPGIGLAVVCDGHGAAVGVLSKSDLVRYLTQRGPAEPSVTTLMTRTIRFCGPDDDVHAVWRTMVAQDLQNLPVLGVGSKPLGVLDIRDAMKALFEEEELQEHMLVSYIAGTGYH